VGDEVEESQQLFGRAVDSNKADCRFGGMIPKITEHGTILVIKSNLKQHRNSASDLGQMNRHLNFFGSLILHGIVSSFFLILNSVGFLYAEIIRYLNLKVSLDNTKHVIVITGCDSGFGDLSSRRLASLGFQVVSGCITSEGAERLKGTVSFHSEEISWGCRLLYQSSVT
jgi:hypothetical protein